MRQVTTVLFSVLFLIILSCPAMAVVSGSNTVDTNYMYLYSDSGGYGSVRGMWNDFTSWTVVDETPELISVTGIYLNGDPGDGYLGYVATAGMGLIEFDFSGTAGDDEYYAEVLYLDDGSIGSITAGLWGEVSTFGDYQSFLASGVVPTAFSSLVRRNATPIPGAIWLLGTGVAGLFGLRRKMKR